MPSSLCGPEPGAEGRPRNDPRTRAGATLSPADSRAATLGGTGSLQAEAVEGVGPALPVRVHPDLGLQVHPGAEQRPRARGGPSCPASRITAPPLPITIPFWESRSTRTTTRYRRIVVLVLRSSSASRRPRRAARRSPRSSAAARRGRSRGASRAPARPRARLGLVADDAVRVVHGPAAAAGPRARRPARRRLRRCGPRAGRTPRSPRARRSTRPRWSATSARLAASVLFSTSTLGVRDLVHELGDEPVAAADRRVRLDEQAHDVDLGERLHRAAVAPLAEQRARLVDPRACRAGRSGTRRWCARRGSACASSAAGSRRSRPSSRRAGSRASTSPRSAGRRG